MPPPDERERRAEESRQNEIRLEDRNERESSGRLRRERVKRDQREDDRDPPYGDASQPIYLFTAQART